MKLCGQELIEHYETEKMMYRLTMARLVSVMETMMVDQCIHPAYNIMVADALEIAWTCQAWIGEWDAEQAA